MGEDMSEVSMNILNFENESENVFEEIIAHVKETDSTQRGKARVALRKWSDAETFDLIATVETKPAVWQFSNPGYSKTPVREACWANISQTICKGKIDANECAVKWQNLRNQARKEFKKMVSTKSGQGLEYKGKWKFFDAMMFVCTSERESSTMSVSTLDDSSVRQVVINVLFSVFLSNESISFSISFQVEECDKR